MFDRLLIANRGEIACRIMRTAHAMGLRCIAVYSQADRHARHVVLADEAHLIGPAPAAESYLRGEAILEVARRSGTQAIHPGYGFLAENAAFAQACGDAGLVFVGPPPDAIRAMGSKSEAKALMAEAGVPIVPGYHGDAQEPDRLAAAAAEIGYPVLIKASAGGGGKGMRQVRRPEDFADALAAARREAQGAFGDDRVLIEKWLERPRHIEVQVFADRHGRVVHLFERDCSLQRRHQKVVEEAPAPDLDEALRAEMGAAAVRAATAIGYVGAGTVEFIVAGDQFYFMEMNTRLQVEHPVTEMITGQDLVEWQLRIAAGAPLPCGQDGLAIRGHAVEARIYAEDVARGFLPAVGRLRHLRLPAEGSGVRVDSGVGQGDEITTHYDPMIAKVIVWGEDRPRALRRLEQALAVTEVVGPVANVNFLVALLRDSRIRAGATDTGFIERHDWPAADPAPDDDVLALACLGELLERARAARAAAAATADPHTPWAGGNGWRLNVEAQELLVWQRAGGNVEVTVHYLRRGGYRLDLPDGALEVSGELAGDGCLFADLGGRRARCTIVRGTGELTVFHGGLGYRLRLADPHRREHREAAASGRLTAPMPGKVIDVPVTAGQEVERGAALIVLEAMKMEHAVVAPAAGRVRELYFAVGDLVEEGAELLRFEAREE